VGFHGDMANNGEPLVRVLRGDREESVHTGALVLWEGDRVLLSRGDPSRVVFYRSASKPLQALELVRSGAAEAMGLSDAEIAVAAGSHSGEARHLETVRSLLAKAGVPENALRCGGHRSVNPDVAFAQRRDGVAVTPILSNCSGKHAGMLAVARRQRAPLESYMDLSHPVQQAILGHVATFAGLPRDRIFAGVDGCGAPALALPLEAMARSLQRFGVPDDVKDAALQAAARRVAAAMRAHPEMVGGVERFDTDLIVASQGRVLAKAGAEGVHAFAVPERRMGFAIKVDDGNDRGYRTVVLEVLRRFGVLAETVVEPLRARYANPTLTSLAGAPVGRMEMAF